MKNRFPVRVGNDKLCVNYIHLKTVLVYLPLSCEIYVIQLFLKGFALRNAGMQEIFVI